MVTLSICIHAHHLNPCRILPASSHDYVGVGVGDCIFPPCNVTFCLGVARALPLWTRSVRPALPPSTIQLARNPIATLLVGHGARFVTSVSRCFCPSFWLGLDMRRGRHSTRRRHRRPRRGRGR